MRVHRTTQQRGFTLAELMFIASLVAILTAVAVPALQDARVSARQAACQDKLKQLGRALHNYHDVYSRFPSAWYPRYAAADSRPWTSWQISILPFFGQASLYNNVKEAMPEPEWDPNWPRAKESIEQYRCPSDTLGDTNPMRGGYGTSNYSGCTGGLTRNQLFTGSAQEFWPGAVRTFEFGRANEGILEPGHSVKMRDITDGLTSTILLVERSAISGAGIWIGVRQNRMENDSVTDLSFVSPINQSWTGPSSFHSGGINALMADGAVRFIDQNIESGPVSKDNQRKPLQALAGIRDGVQTEKK